MAAWYMGEHEEWAGCKGDKSLGTCVVLEPGAHDMSYLEHNTVKLDVFTTAASVGATHLWKGRGGPMHSTTG